MTGHDTRLDTAIALQNRSRWDPKNPGSGDRYYCPVEKQYYRTFYASKHTGQPLCPRGHRLLIMAVGD